MLVHVPGTVFVYLRCVFHDNVFQSVEVFQSVAVGMVSVFVARRARVLQKLGFVCELLRTSEVRVELDSAPIVDSLTAAGFRRKVKGQTVEQVLLAGNWLRAPRMEAG